MKILIVSAEVAPFAKVGGLADVAGALPKALAALGHDVRVVMPCYKMIESDPAYDAALLASHFEVPAPFGEVDFAFLKRTFIKAPPSQGANDSAIPVLLIGSHGRPDRTGYFQEATESRKVYSLRPDPYVFFCRAVLELFRQAGEGGLPDAWFPDVIHCNDWQTGLIPVFAREWYADFPPLASAAYLFTIHNLAYQGNFNYEDWHATGLPNSLYQVNGLEFYGGWSFLKGALTFSDAINTVSETYAQEIRTAAYGCGLDGLMRTLAGTGRLSGIMNGIDYDEYNPATDHRIACNFDLDNRDGKAVCKAALQQELGLLERPEVPIVGIVSRLADQKGLDLISTVADAMVDMPAQFVLLGAGDPNYERFFAQLQERRPGMVHARIGFDLALAQRIYSGSDLFLMPSRFEPCGLGQMMALRYGTIPIVRSTGGLADSIHDYATNSGNGFVFSDYSSEALWRTIERAVSVFHDRAAWQKLVTTAMRCDFSWARSAARYETWYITALQSRETGNLPLYAA